MNRFFSIFLIIFMVVSFSGLSVAVENSDMTGQWEGDIDLSGQLLNIVVKITESDGDLSGTLDIPQQGAFGIPIKKIEINEEKIIMTVPQLPGNATFNGEIEKDKIDGEFQQSGYNFPFKLNKVSEKEAIINKEIKYNVGEYEIIESELKIPVQGGKISGTLAKPEDIAKDVPLVILVAGSGPTDRNGNNPLLGRNINTLKEIAHYLSSNGIMTYRYDKRGIGESSELTKEENPSFLDYRDDLITIIEYLDNYPQVKKDNVYVLGHSEGSMLTIMAAEKGADLDGLILVSGSGHTHGETLKTQITAIAEQYEKAGMEDVKKEMLTALDDLYKAVRTDSNFDINEYNIPDKMKDTYLSIANQPKFVKDWLDVDPVALLKEVNKPVCIIQGTNDGRVGVKDAEMLASAVPNQKLELHILQGVNHYLKEAETDNPAYEDQMPANLLKIIYDFVN
ncbi:MAG: alpha/beta hydrolase family protein [Bacillota bacterium]